MQVFRGLSAIPSPLRGGALTIGNFDGLHLGHQKLIQCVLAQAKACGGASVVLTFDPHPVTVLKPGTKPAPLFDREELVFQLRARGVDILVIEPFTEALSLLSPKEFVHRLVKAICPKRLVIGYDFAFGRGRQGDAMELKVLGDLNDFVVEQVGPVKIKGEIVSSTGIRKALLSGHPELAQEFLGRPYFLQGRIERGQGRGGPLGFPTANFLSPYSGILRRGVYVTRSIILDRAYSSVSNVGVAPTFGSEDAGEGPCQVETHILDQNMNLYGSLLRVEFLRYLREEKKFNSTGDLQVQINKDIERAREFFAGPCP